MDYHALRTTFITRLPAMKVHPRLAMELARHSDMRLTMKTARMQDNCRCAK